MHKPCPLTVRPGQILGLRPARRHEKPGLYPIFAIGGASPEGDDAAAQAAADAAAAAKAAEDKAAADKAAADAAAAGGGATWDGKIESLDPEVQKVVKKYQDEAASASSKARDKARTDAQQEILKKLGLVQDGEKPDPDKLAKDLQDARDETLSLKRERAAEKAARTHGADVDELMERRSFHAALKKLDPTADDFATALDALVKATVDANPKLKATLAAAASGVDGAGGSGEKPTGDPKSVDEMRKLLKPKG